MATTTQIAAPARRHSPLALWHLLSLDAPTVAALWTWFIARVAGIRLPAISAVAMALAVWILYVADRLLDTRHLGSGRRVPAELEARHIFHYRYRPAFLVGAGVASVALAGLLPLLSMTALQIYLVEGVLLIAWFVAVHSVRTRLPKELVVGLYFSAATFTPTIARRPQHLTALLVSAGLFATLCTLNCLFIHAWESAEQEQSVSLAAATLILACACAISGVLVKQPIAGACALAGLLLLAVHKNRTRLSRTHLRAAADLALLTPVLLLPFLR